MRLGAVVIGLDDDDLRGDYQPLFSPSFLFPDVDFFFFSICSRPIDDFSITLPLDVKSATTKVPFRFTSREENHRITKENALSYLLSGMSAPGDDGHTAHFHDCSCSQVSTRLNSSSLHSRTLCPEIEYVRKPLHFIFQEFRRSWRRGCAGGRCPSVECLRRQHCTATACFSFSFAGGCVCLRLIGPLTAPETSPSPVSFSWSGLCLGAKSLTAGVTVCLLPPASRPRQQKGWIGGIASRGLLI